MIHTSAWWGKVAASGGMGITDRIFQGLRGVPDQTLGLSNDNLVPSAPLALVAAAATGHASEPSSNVELVSVRLQTPKTLVSPIYVQPVNSDGLFNDNPNVASFVGNAPLLRADEEIAASAWVVSDGSMMPAPVALITWFCDRPEPIPPGDSYWVAFYAKVPSLLEGQWSPGTFTFLDQTTLPSGRYSIIGMQVFQAGGGYGPVCARLVIPNEVMRPGALVLQRPSARIPLMEMDGSLGVWGRFLAQQPLSIEVFSPFTSGYAELFGYLRVVQQDR